MEPYDDKGGGETTTNPIDGSTAMLQKDKDPQPTNRTDTLLDDHDRSDAETQGIKDIDNAEDATKDEHGMDSLVNEMDEPASLPKKLKIELRKLLESEPLHTCFAVIEPACRLSWISHTLVSQLQLPIDSRTTRFAFPAEDSHWTRTTAGKHLKPLGFVELILQPAKNSEYVPQRHWEEFYVTADELEASVVISRWSMAIISLIKQSPTSARRQFPQYEPILQTGRGKASVPEKSWFKNPMIGNQDDSKSLRTLLTSKTAFRARFRHDLSNLDDQAPGSRASSTKPPQMIRSTQTDSVNKPSSNQPRNLVQAESALFPKIDKPILLQNLVSVTTALLERLDEARLEEIGPWHQSWYHGMEHDFTKFLTTLTGVELRLRNSITTFPALEAVFKGENLDEDGTETVRRLVDEMQGTLTAIDFATDKGVWNHIGAKDRDTRTQHRLHIAETLGSWEDVVVNRLNHVMKCIAQFTSRVAWATETDHMSSLARFADQRIAHIGRLRATFAYYESLYFLDYQHNVGVSSHKGAISDTDLVERLEAIPENDQKRRIMELAILIDQQRGYYKRALSRLQSLRSRYPLTMNSQWISDTEIRLDWQHRHEETTPQWGDESQAEIDRRKSNTLEKLLLESKTEYVGDILTEMNQQQNYVDVIEVMDEDNKANTQPSINQRSFEAIESWSANEQGYVTVETDSKQEDSVQTSREDSEESEGSISSSKIIMHQLSPSVSYQSPFMLEGPNIAKLPQLETHDPTLDGSRRLPLEGNKQQDEISTTNWGQYESAEEQLQLEKNPIPTDPEGIYFHHWVPPEPDQDEVQSDAVTTTGLRKIEASIHNSIKGRRVGSVTASGRRKSQVALLGRLGSEGTNDLAAEPVRAASTTEALLPSVSASPSIDPPSTHDGSRDDGAQESGITYSPSRGRLQRRDSLESLEVRKLAELARTERKLSGFDFPVTSDGSSLQDSSPLQASPSTLLQVNNDETLSSPAMPAKLPSILPSQNTLQLISADTKILHEDANKAELPAPKIEPQTPILSDEDIVPTRTCSPNVERHSDVEVDEPDKSLTPSVDYEGIPHRLRKASDHAANYLRTCWNSLTRPRIRPGYRRVEWICECGEKLYGDFDNSQPEAVDAIAEVVNHPSGATRSSTSASSASTTSSTVGPSSSSITSSWKTSETGRDMGDETSRDPFYASGGNGHVDLTESKRYFELCVNHSSLEKRLGEVDISTVKNDGMFFRLIKDRYVSVRGSWTTFLYLRKPVDVEYVRFTLEDRYRVWVFEKPLSWPSETEVEERRWDFEHPLNPPPPMPAPAFLHYLKTPEAHHENKWLPRLPKKLMVSILQEQAALPSAWGVNITEGPDQAVILLLLAFALSMSLLVSVVWSVCKNDVAAGMAIGQYLVAMIAIVATLIAATWQNF
ncbi:hypothetical protein MMC11_003110 [Xylographa trunciseda]|nr:hypothetical protein [Xylographa trunciseda]